MAKPPAATAHRGARQGRIPGESVLKRHHTGRPDTTLNLQRFFLGADCGGPNERLASACARHSASCLRESGGADPLDERSCPNSMEWVFERSGSIVGLGRGCMLSSFDSAFGALMRKACQGPFTIHPGRPAAEHIPWHEPLPRKGASPSAGTRERTCSSEQTVGAGRPSSLHRCASFAICASMHALVHGLARVGPAEGIREAAQGVPEA
jgi:hypothetical protein